MALSLRGGGALGEGSSPLVPLYLMIVVDYEKTKSNHFRILFFSVRPNTFPFLQVYTASQAPVGICCGAAVFLVPFDEEPVRNTRRNRP